MKNAALILADEFEAIRATGNLGGQALLGQRMKALDYSTQTEYFSFILDNASQIEKMLNHVKASGEWHRGYGTLSRECLDTVFMFKTGWGDVQANGPSRVALHTIHNLESLGKDFNNIRRTKQLTEEQIEKIRAELEGLRDFVTENSPSSKNQAFILAGIEYILRLLDDDYIDHALLSSEISSLIGLLVLFVSTDIPESEKGAWFDRIKVGAILFGTELLVSTTSNMASIGFQRWIGIEQ